MSNAPHNPATDDDAQVVHLFTCLGDGHYAVSTDPTGANIPSDRCVSGWKHVREVALGVREALPFAENPEPIIRAIQASGYCILGSDTPHGTSQ